MEILSFNGIPGSGKTLTATYYALKHFKRENSIIKKSFIYLFSLFPGKIGKICKDKISYYKLFPAGKINNVYTSYPILLDKKNNIYSHKWSIFDFDNRWSFLPNALFIDDEIQLKIDSDEYNDDFKKKKIAKIAKFCQAARHFGCSGIILTCQHPSRLFKKMRNVASGFVQHKQMFKIPILNIGFVRTIKYFIIDDYGKFIPKDRKKRQELTFEYKKKIIFMDFNKVFSAYDSRYLSEYNYSKPLYNKGLYKSKKVEYKDLVGLFE